jgi:hypothetical protein
MLKFVQKLNNLYCFDIQFIGVGCLLVGENNIKFLNLFTTFVLNTEILTDLHGESNDDVNDVQQSKFVVTKISEKNAAFIFRGQNGK